VITRFEHSKLRSQTDVFMQHAHQAFCFQKSDNTQLSAMMTDRQYGNFDADCIKDKTE
jgi:hypothetical protein